MSTETHINTLVQDVEEAYTAASAALGDFKNKVDTLKARLLADGKELGNAVEAGVEAAKAELDKGETASAEKPADETKAEESKPDESNKDKATSTK